ncbi:putative regulator of amino acid metabolism with ACT domain [Methanomicrobium sp. W14]|uniref:regulator of amino acid metabolism, contains ACT domain protein n=1 Tax=Methanomicrobium sp. W14 TaxID=2817839 RepID=UPI001AE7557B|nr:regulator of amino acid metabolism, contains ACT domain protein [Methanomicrobium sp. W14]MBP2132586.1 putative regulator of amino acid metabolism with ACT domain [Methanomicrobium sp. W14]
MWASILSEFSDSPSQTLIVKYLLENGFGVNETGRIICNGIEIPATHIGRITKTDRRVVDATAKRILSTPSIREIFLNLRATPDLSNVAEHLDLSVITIYPKDAGQKGIVGAAVEVLTKYDLSIRQIFVTDSQLSEDPRLVIIVEKNPPSSVYEELKKLPQVRQIII